MDKIANRLLVILFLIIVGLAFSNLTYPMNKHTNEVIQLLQNLAVQHPYYYQNLTIFPITLKHIEDHTNYLTLDEALQKDYLEITELGGGRVNQVMVENYSKYYIFLMSGEILSGCKQDRMVKDDVLIPPHSGKINIEVYCTEHGRWTPVSKQFVTKNYNANISVRQRAKLTTSQSIVWDEIASCQAGLGIKAPTGTIAKTYEDKSVQRKTQVYIDKLIKEIPPDAVGVVIAVGNRIMCADIFCNPQIFQKLWPKLLHSYTLDAICQVQHKCHLSVKDIYQFLHQARKASYQYHHTSGLGQLLTIKSSEVSGSALTYKYTILHFELFPNHFQPLERISTPSQRQQLLP